jgi:hypothetical protein
VLAGLCGGLALAGALFWLGERVFPIPRMGGRWFVQTFVEDTARKQFGGMYLKYEIIIWQEGPAIRGTAEKIYESSSTGRRQYEGHNRSRGEVSGYASRHVFLSNRAELHMLETGSQRTFTSYFDVVSPKGSLLLRLIGKDPRLRNSDGLIQEQMHGRFGSTAGSTSGKTIWSRNRYDPEFHPDVAQELSDAYGAIERISAEAGLEEAE